ncbi:flavonol reductase/cinnamoyl-CoA reductase family protein [Schizosaccharomyces cryophilus OY26]|uniref:Flavonol reductase/cinnamoyl-CoA reductase family protein n=1 Tax=Schizosaccharomyces cryophilus (strain OY26 / ATCC MYA-4695 / CBS 11777 / NBRC 106824 / NRRL Y48691) TaxID=653667 RepID=S9XHH1_SCHCR|nr:flavonol reductase/cinnamoyl-CoA reductase family protein [Schizosaccharomyces cryophilus OY26]EPY53126.1 flavonol reductase/cinnamoyl-CoA reductase family protein [Schizosaccharomyces cryophilus OY26]
MTQISPLVLVTGINGFLGSHTVEALLAHGYRVRGTHQSPQDPNILLHNRPSWKDKVEMVHIPDHRIPNAYDEAIRGVDYVIHVAAEVHSNGETPGIDPHHTLTVSIKGTENALSAAFKEPKVKRFVYVSSDAALKGPKNYNGDGYVFTEKDWNPLTLQDAKTSNDEGLNYTTVHNFFATHKPHFEVIALNPPLILGPVFHLKSVNQLSFSAWFFWQLINGRYDIAPKTEIFNYVDVRDLAESEVLALTALTKEPRVIICAGDLTNDKIVNAVLPHFPQFQDKIAKPNGQLSTCNYQIDASLSKSVLGIKYRPHEETFCDAAASLYRLAGLLS